MKAQIGVIGGTGVYNPNLLADIHEEKILSEYGEVIVKIGTYKGIPVAFLARHGYGHTVPPHLINYRANIKALKKLGCQKVIATGAVGSLNMEYKPGDFLLVDQFIDATKNRVNTFYEGGEQGVLHVDMTQPYCPNVRNVLANAAPKAHIPLHAGKATYVCTEGPRFETPAEIKMYKMLGADVVGMTSVPEVVLAREAEMCYATIGMVTNYAAGITDNNLTHQEVIDIMKNTQENLQNFIAVAIEEMTKEATSSCHCHNATVELGKF